MKLTINTTIRHQAQLKRYTKMSGEGCLVWLGAVEKELYPICRWRGKRISPRALVVHFHFGLPLSEFVEAKMLCGDTFCINVQHMYIRNRIDSIADKKRIIKLLEFNSKRMRTKGCLEWIGNRDKDGYGTMAIQKQTYKTHRLSAMVHLNFEINRNDLLVCHTCDNPPCVNGEHLFVGTNKDNTQDMLRKGTVPNTEMSKEDVLKLRRLHKTGKYLIKDLVEMSGFGRESVRKMIRGKSFKFIN